MGIKYLFLLAVVASFTYAAGDMKILQQGKNFLVVEYLPSYSDTNLISANSPYRNTHFQGMSISNPYEFGMVPNLYRKFIFGIPNSQVPFIEVLQSGFKEISGQPALIAKPIRVDGKLEFDNQYKSVNAENVIIKKGNEIIRLGETTTLRGMNIQEVLVFPVSDGSSSNSIRLLTKIIFKITFSGSISENDSYQDELLDGIVPNYNQAKRWVKPNYSLNKIVTNSVLASGKWYKFTVPQEGIYRINRSNLASYGIDANQVDPRTIKIYNNGGKILPENSNIDRPIDPLEISISVIGEEDGRFDEGDYILFYARSLQFWEYGNAQKKFIRNVHPYTENNFYFITSGNGVGKRMQIFSAVDIAGSVPVNSTTAFKHLDDDKINIGKSGRYFMGDEFSEYTKTKTYMNKLDGYIPGSQIRYRYRFANSFSNAVAFQVTENSTIIINKFLQGFGGDQYVYAVPDTGTVVFSETLADSRSVLKFTYNASGAASKGYLDFFEIYYNRSLSASETDEVIFFSPAANGNFEYQLNNFSNTSINVYDVTDFSNVKIIKHNFYPSGGEFKFSMTESANNVKKYYAGNDSKILSPTPVAELKNQNIKSFSDGVKFVIIAPDEFLTQAERLADYRSSVSKFPFSSKVFSVSEIFNEFACGIRDFTAVRDFLKYAYNNWTVKPDYVLLLGDGDYDYKNIEKAGVNFIPPYETDDSFYEIYSFNSDDYFGVVTGTTAYLEIPVGRMPVQNLREATIAVDKIIDYENNAEKTLWRNLVTLVADDGLTSTGNEGSLHTGQSETLTSYIPASYDLKKIYLASYPTVLTSFGRRKPAVNEAIINAVNEGTLILNYIGHGSPELWAHEQVFVKDVTIPQIINKDYFLVTAATCDFGYFDKTNAQSAAELLLHKEKSGAIGVFTATRPVFSTFNAALNERFFNGLLNSGRDPEGLPFTLGKAYYSAKINSNLDNDRKFHLLADPSLRLAIPLLPGTIDSVNSQSTVTSVQINALNPVSLVGSIHNTDGTAKTDFNGEGILTVYDSERFAPVPEFGSNYTIKQQGGIIFKGKVSITNGAFGASFIVPKDISYETRNGKIVMYFFNENQDGLAFTKNILVGSSGNPIPNDGKGPDIEIYFDSYDNISGSLIRPNSSLLLKISDETGLNTTGLGLGHKMEAILNDNEAAPIDLSNYFTGELDSGGKLGRVQYPFSNLSKGNYKLSISAWDVFNNNSTEISFFAVSSETGNDVTDVYNYPNPFSDNTHFTLQHNFASPVNVKIRVYSVAGRLLYEDVAQNMTDRFIRIPWNGRDKDGDMLANGTYLYKVVVSTTDGSIVREFLSKLSIIK